MGQQLKTHSQIMSDLDWKSDLDPLLNPESIALIGASENSAWSTALAQNLKELGYKGKLYPVNPKREEVFGIKCYPSAVDIPGPVDAFIIAISRDFIVPVLQDCARKGIRAGVIISAGFAEASEAGKAIQQQIVEIASKGKIRICGPNSFGVANLHQGVSLISSSEVRYLKPGGVSLVFQSGGLLNAALLAAWDRSWGVGCAISCGNEAVLNIADYADYLIRDENTRLLGILTEGFRDPEKFLRVAKLAAELHKPIVILKLGKSEKGKHAAQAHTGTLVGSDAVYSAVFKQHGLTRVGDLDDFIETVELFSKRKKLRGHQVGVIVPSGAECGLVADMAEDAGVDLPELSATTVEKLSTTKSDYLSLRNPLNAPERYVRRGDVFRQWIETLVDDENLDIVGLRLPLPRRREDEDVIARFRDLAEIAKRTEKLIVLFSRASISLPEYWRKLLGENNIPFLLEYRRGFKALSALIDYDRFLRGGRAPASEMAIEVDRRRIARLLSTSGCAMTERRSKEILAEYGILTTREALARSEEEAVALAKAIRYPVVLKVESAQIAHKTEAGAVKINIQNESELRRCYREILKNVQSYDSSAVIEGILVQEMITSGKEVIVGMTCDAQFGPVIIVGLGGIFVEVINDVAMRVANLTKSDALDMICELKGYRILKGARGEGASDVDALAEILCRFSRLSTDLADEIAEIDINPLIVFESGKGAVAVDCLMRRKDRREN
jgi:acetate---CoA ligase (ADP-forming)